MLNCPQCKYYNPLTAKYCNNCGIRFPAPISKNNNQKTSVHNEKVIVILSLTIVSTLILGMTALFCIERSKGFSSKTNSMTSAPTENEIERREQAVRNFNNDLIYDTKGTPVTFHLQGKFYDTIVMFSPTLTYELYQDFGKNNEVKRKFRQEGFKTVIFENGKQQWNYDLVKDY